MSPSIIPAGSDAVEPRNQGTLAITLDGQRIEGLAGQTLAGVLLGSGRLSWRRTSASGRPRGVFCGIGVCFDCIASVNGDRDVRLCQRRATDGDAVEVQHDLLPGAVRPLPPAAPDAGSSRTAAPEAGAADTTAPALPEGEAHP